VAAPARKKQAATQKSPARTKMDTPTEIRHRYSVSLVTQGRHRFFTLTVPSDVLARTCFVTTRSEDPIQGFQRALDRRRAEEIAKYIDSGFGTIPSSIVLSAQPDANVQILGRKTLEFTETPKAFLILDGQHRVYGFSMAKTELRVPVVIYNNLSRKDESRLFIDINTKQRPVPNALLLDIAKLADYQDEEEQILGEVFDLFYDRKDSALRGLLSRSEQTLGRISRVTFNTALNSILSVFEGREADEIYETLSPYYAVWLSGLSAIDASDALTKSVVFRAVTATFPAVVQRVIDRHGREFERENFAEILNEDFFKRIRARMRKNAGNSVRAIVDDLSVALRVPIRI
jgi:DGQHR domain-containing protein